MNLLYFILISYGITNIVAKEAIFSVIRSKITNKFLKSMISCPTCLGFWIGLLLFPLIPLNITSFYVINWLLSGFISSGINNLIDNLKNNVFGYE